MSKIKNGGLTSMALDPLNSSNLEQLALKGLNKIHNPTLCLTGGHSVPPTASSRNLGFIFILIFPSPITSLLSLVHVSTTFVIFVALALFLTLIRLAPVGHLSFTLDMAIAI